MRQRGEKSEASWEKKGERGRREERRRATGSKGEGKYAAV